jgi:competence CoiA-like predicted nuclease
MNIAKNAQQEIIHAENAKYGIYFCTECEQLVYLRQPSHQVPHFYHHRFNSDCSLCTLNNNEVWRLKLQESLNAQEILKNSTPENWANAIECLIRNDHLYLLSGYEWALKPVSMYINNHIEIITHDNLFNLLLTIINHESRNCTSVLFRLIFLPKITKSDQLKIFELFLNGCSLISDNLIDQLMEENISIDVLYNIFPYMTNKKQKELFRKQKYMAIPYVHKLSSTKLTCTESILLFGKIIERERINFEPTNWIVFLRLLKKQIVKSNRIELDRFNRLIDKEYAKTQDNSKT